MSGLPPYTPEEASIFDDVLAPTVFGLPPETALEDDPKLPVRIRAADSVVVVRIATVSQELSDDTREYTLGLVPEGSPLLGRVPDPHLELDIETDNPSLGSVQAHGDRLVGTRFVLFLRHFVQAGEPRVHWYGDGDVPGLTALLGHAKALDGRRTGVQTAR